MQVRLKKLEELERKLDSALSDIDTLKFASAKLVTEGNENALKIVGEVESHWALFRLKVQFLYYCYHL